MLAAGARVNEGRKIVREIVAVALQGDAEREGKRQSDLSLAVAVGSNTRKLPTATARKTEGSDS